MKPAARTPSPVFSLVAIGGIILLANAGLLVLQLCAGKLLAPFVGSSLETWTTVIGVFLAGIAAGNWFGASLAPTRKTLVAVLVASALGSFWMVGFPELLHRTNLHTAWPLLARIIVLTTLLCFPPGFFLALLTPLAVRLGTRDVRIGGRIAGLTFALGTLGCLAGNYLTGFWLIPTLTINSIVIAVGGLLSALVAIPFVMPNPDESVIQTAHSTTDINLKPAYLIVFMCSFAGMALELAGVRLMAHIVGVSLFTWTGVIGVMLAGTCLGNALGGLIADAAASRGHSRRSLATSLVIAGGFTVMVLIWYVLFTGEWFLGKALGQWFHSLNLINKILGWSFAFFFLPMLLLGTISPQVIRLFTPDAAHAGTVAGRVYAVSTIGAIAGTFLTGFVLVAELGMFRVILLAAVLPIIACLLTCRIWQDLVLLGCATTVAGIATGGMFIYSPQQTGIARESNYFTIQVKDANEPALQKMGVKTMQLDLLVHSWVRLDDPLYLYYAHEQIQLLVLREFANRVTNPKTLVIGGGGYTFPRAARTILPTCPIDVVEIDPAVTEVAYEKLGLDPKLGIQSYHMDGRQFVDEKAAKNAYHVVTLDAVNDLSVPSHLLTKEFNDQVKQVLAPGGAYLVTIIDKPVNGQIWRAAYHTLRQSFPHVHLLSTMEDWDGTQRDLIVLYASDTPLHVADVVAVAERNVLSPRIAAFGGAPATAAPWRFVFEADRKKIDAFMANSRPVLLTDQYAPVDWMMAEVFRTRFDPR
jgi:predicted membrane-bound spermidine synthase